MAKDFNSILDEIASGINVSPLSRTLGDDELDSIANSLGAPGAQGASGPVNLAQSGALPALGEQKLESDLSGFSSFLRSPLGMLTPGIGLVGVQDRLLEMTGQPKGSVTSQVSAAANSALGWVPGLAERAGILPKGTRQGMNEAIENERVSVAAQLDPSLHPAYMTSQGVAEIGGGAMPGGIVGRVGRVASAVTNLTTKGKALARATGVIAEGMTQAAGETAGLQGPEQFKAFELSALLTVLGAKVEAGRFVSNEIKRFGLEAVAKEKQWTFTEQARVADVLKTLESISDVKKAAVADAVAANADRLEAFGRELDSLTEDQRADLRSVVALSTQLPQLEARVQSLREIPEKKLVRSLDDLKELARRKKEQEQEAKNHIYINGKPVGRIDESPSVQRVKEVEEAINRRNIEQGIVDVQAAWSLRGANDPSNKMSLSDFAAETEKKRRKIFEEEWAKVHHGAYKEPWMDELYVEKVDKDGLNEVQMSLGGISPGDIPEYVQLLRKGTADDPFIVRYERPDGSELEMLVMRDSETKKYHMFSLRKIAKGEERGAGALANDADSAKARPMDKIENPEEANKVLQGGLEAAEKTIDEVVDQASLADKIRQSEQEVKTFLWDLYGDPKAKPEANALKIQDGIMAGEQLIANMKQRALEAKARLNSVIPQVVSVLEAMSGMQRLRQTARLEAAKMGDPKIFDAYDISYRRNLSEPGRLQPAELGIRTIEDSLSSYQDAFYATLEKTRKRAAVAYKKMIDNNEPIYNEDGSVKTIEEFVLDQTNLSVAKFQNTLKTLFEASVNAPQDPNAMVRMIDQLTKHLLKKNRIKPDSVGFRGDLAMTYQGIIDDGAEWIHKNLPEGKKLTEISDENLLEIANHARSTKAPLSSFDFLEAESKRRMLGVAPRKLAIRNPTDLARDTARNRKNISDELRNAMFGGDLKSTPTTWLGRTLNKLIVTGRTQGASDLQVSYGSLVPFSGASLFEPLYQLANPKERARALNAIRKVIPNAHREEGVLLHRMTAALTDLESSVNAYADEMSMQGVKIGKQEMYAQIKDAYEGNQLASLPPVIQETIRTKVQPVLNQLSKIVDDTIPDATKRVAIKANMGRYVFRSYAIFADKDAIFKPLDDTTKAYQQGYDAIRAANYDRIKDFAYAKYGKELRKSGLPEDQIQTFIDQYVDQEVRGILSSRVKQHLEYPGQNPKTSPIIGRIAEEYLEDRVLNDPNIRKIMGEEKNFAYAAHLTAAKIASDVANYRIYKGLLDGYRAAGLVSDHAIPNVADVRLNSRTLERIKDGDPEFVGEVVYVNAKVGELFRGIQEHGDPLANLANRFIALVKAGFVISPGGFMANVMSIPQSVLVGSGLVHGIRGLFSDSVIAGQLAKELSNPGTAGHLPEGVARRIYEKFGYSDPQHIRADAEELLRLGLDIGGEIHSYYEEGSQALIEAFARNKGRQARVRKVMVGAGELYRRPDVFAKVITYRSILNELMDKALSDTPTEAMKRIAAERALNLTQNPMTTPAGIRNLSKGVTGLATFGFQGFFYQQARNFYYGMKYATEDAFTSMKLLTESVNDFNAGDAAGALKKRTQAMKHAKYSLDRASGVAIGGYVAYELISNFIGEDSDKEDAVKHFLWADQRNGRYLIRSVEKDKDGKMIANALQLGSTDYFDQTARVINILVGDGTMLQKFLTAKDEIAMQLFQPSALIEAAADVLGYEMDNKNLATAVFSLRPRGSIRAGKENVLIGGEGKAAAITTEGLQKSGRRLVPTVARAAWDLAAIPFTDPLDPIMNRQQFQALRHTTGIRAQRFNMDKLVARRYNEDWNKQSAWISQMKKEWKDARSVPARAEVVKKYEREWDKAYASIVENTNRANELGYTRRDLDNLINSKEYFSVLPGIVKQFAPTSRMLTLRQYLATIE